MHPTTFRNQSVIRVLASNDLKVGVLQTKGKKVLRVKNKLGSLRLEFFGITTLFREHVCRNRA